jgi:O-antigen ligase
VAVMMCGLTFVFAREIINKRHLFWNLLMMIGSITILLATESSTGVMALAMGLFLEFLVFINRMTGGRRGRVFSILMEGLVCALLLLILYRLLYSYAFSWISNDSNGLGRLEIFANIKTTFEMDPFFGLGPGMHSKIDGRLIEYHNTYLEILAASGIVGAIAFLIFTIRLLQKVTKDTSFLPAVAAMYAYGFAGFAMRRLVYWGIVVFVLVICEQLGKGSYIAYDAREPE